VAHFQAQPEGLGLFLPSAALSVAYVESLHGAPSALLKAKRVPAVPKMKDKQTLMKYLFIELKI
jgi:hypothetical protein